jgi:hypothetical protein
MNDRELLKRGKMKGMIFVYRPGHEVTTDLSSQRSQLD